MKSNLKNILLFVLLFFTKNYCIAQQLHHLSVEELIKLQFIPKNHIEKFEQLQVQDFQGRIKPINTLALNLLRKVYGKNDFKYASAEDKQYKLNASQVFLGMQYRPDAWQLIPCIKVEKSTRDTISKIIEVSKNNLVKPAHFFDFHGNINFKK